MLTRPRRRRTRAGLLALALVLAPASARAQVGEAALRVTVVDPSGAVIVGAQVTIGPVGAPPAAGAPRLATDGRGDALFSALVPGRYAIHVESPGFEPTDVRTCACARARRGTG